MTAPIDKIPTMVIMRLDLIS